MATRLTLRAILSVACGHWYPAGQQRLFDSLQEREESTTRLFWRDQLPPGSPTHAQAPYGFKPYAFSHAKTLGFEQALWLDASVWAVRPLDDVWAALDDAGYYLEADGHQVGSWTSDAALELLGVTRDQAMGMPLPDGKIIGLDFRSSVVSSFLQEWKELADAGAFHGAWTNEHGQVSSDPRCLGHRHDISCAGVLAHRLGLELQDMKRLWFPAAGPHPDHAVVLAQGM